MKEELQISFCLGKKNVPRREGSSTYAEPMSYDSYLSEACYPLQSLQQTIVVIHCREANNTFRCVWYFLHLVEEYGQWESPSRDKINCKWAHSSWKHLIHILHIISFYLSHYLFKSLLSHDIKKYHPDYHMHILSFSSIGFETYRAFQGFY